MEFVSSLIGVLGTVFTEYIPDLATGVVSMFTSIFTTTDGSLTTIAQALICLAGIGIVTSIFRLVYGIFKGKMKKRV